MAYSLTSISIQNNDLKEINLINDEKTQEIEETELEDSLKGIPNENQFEINNNDNNSENDPQEVNNCQDKNEEGESGLYNIILLMI